MHLSDHMNPVFDQTLNPALIQPLNPAFNQALNAVSIRPLKLAFDQTLNPVFVQISTGEFCTINGDIFIGKIFSRVAYLVKIKHKVWNSEQFCTNVCTCVNAVSSLLHKILSEMYIYFYLKLF